MKRLLLVEDAVEIVAVLLLIFRPARFVVTVAETLAAGRTALANRPPPDLVVLDVDPPDGTGLELCREIKAATPLLPILAFKASAVSRREALAAGADRFWPHPFDASDLEGHVEELLLARAGDGLARHPKDAGNGGTRDRVA